MPDYSKSNDGRIHVLNALIGEYTLCGNAFDGDALTGSGAPNQPHAHEPTPRGPVTCAECALIINGLKGVRISKKLKEPSNGND